MRYPFDPKAGVILVKTKLYGPRGDTIVNLALDTGATFTLINWETAALLGYDPSSIQERTAITTGSGIEYCPKLVLKRLQAFGKTVSRLDALCHTLPPSSRVDGLLGLNFLRRFDRRINFSSRSQSSVAHARFE